MVTISDQISDGKIWSLLGTRSSFYNLMTAIITIFFSHRKLITKF